MTNYSWTSLKRTISGMNYNVKLVFAYSFFQSLGRGIWMGNVLSNYIYLIAGESNELLGLTSAITGLAMTMTVIPSGYLSDRIQRRYILRLASAVGFIGLIIAFLAQSLEMIFLALLFCSIGIRIHFSGSKINKFFGWWILKFYSTDECIKRTFL